MVVRVALIRLQRNRPPSRARARAVVASVRMCGRARGVYSLPHRLLNILTLARRPAVFALVFALGVPVRQLRASVIVVAAAACPCLNLNRNRYRYPSRHLRPASPPQGPRRLRQPR